MKRRTFIKTGVTGAVSLAMGQVIAAGKKRGKARDTQDIVPLSAAEEIEMLVFMREEEKLARDVYRVLFEQWGIKVFKNISRSEEQHMAALAGRLSYYQVPDPIVDDSTGAFVDTGLATAYLDLTEWGMKSREDAFMVGAYIEELDILDLQHSIAVSVHDDLVAVYEELMKGSRNHLRAFVRQIENLGIVYQAQLMDQADVDEIVNTPLERG
jgi:hypothetical protein